MILQEDILRYPQHIIAPYLRPDVTFKMEFEVWGAKMAQEEKVRCIDKMDSVPFEVRATAASFSGLHVIQNLLRSFVCS